MMNTQLETGKSRSSKMTRSRDLAFSGRLAFIGLCYIYLVKIIDTLLHGMFSHPAFSYSIVSLNIIAGVAQLYFFITLYFYFTGQERIAYFAGWFGIIGSSLNMLPKILALSLLVQYDFLTKFLMHGQTIAVVAPWLGYVLLFTYCLLLSRYKPGFGGIKARAFVSGAVGYFVLATAFSILVYNYSSGVRINWGEEETGIPAIMLILSSSFSFLCIAYFYASFFHLRNDS